MPTLANYPRSSDEVRGMIDTPIAGRLYGAPVARTTKAGKPYCTSKVRVSTRDGEALFLDEDYSSFWPPNSGRYRAAGPGRKWTHVGVTATVSRRVA
jgi:hypothetical protein